MNEPPKTLTQAVDDLRLIRQVLDQTATSFRTLAPEFSAWGWSGWFTASSPAWSSGRTPWPSSYLRPSPGGTPPRGCPASCPPSSLGPVALWGYLLVQCILWQRKKGTFPALGEGAGHLAGAAGALPPAVPAAGGGFQYHPPCPCPLNPQVLPGITLGPSSTTVYSSCPSSSLIP